MLRSTVARALIRAYKYYHGSYFDNEELPFYLDRNILETYREIFLEAVSLRDRKKLGRLINAVLANYDELQQALNLDIKEVRDLVYNYVSSKLSSSSSEKSQLDFRMILFMLARYIPIVVDEIIVYKPESLDEIPVTGSQRTIQILLSGLLRRNIEINIKEGTVKIKDRVIKAPDARVVKLLLSLNLRDRVYDAVTNRILESLPDSYVMGHDIPPIRIPYILAVKISPSIISYGEDSLAPEEIYAIFFSGLERYPTLDIAIQVNSHKYSVYKSIKVDINSIADDIRNALLEVMEYINNIKNKINEVYSLRDKLSVEITPWKSSEEMTVVYKIVSERINGEILIGRDGDISGTIAVSTSSNGIWKPLLIKNLPRDVRVNQLTNTIVAQTAFSGDVSELINKYNMIIDGIRKTREECDRLAKQAKQVAVADRRRYVILAYILNEFDIAPPECVVGLDKKYVYGIIGSMLYRLSRGRYDWYEAEDEAELVLGYLAKRGIISVENEGTVLIQNKTVSELINKLPREIKEQFDSNIEERLHYYIGALL